MSATADVRKMAGKSRRPSATPGAQSGAPSRLGARESRPLSSTEVIPEDSASNGPHRRSPSGAQKQNGTTTMFSERRTGRVHLASRDNLQVRTRSPVKASISDGVEDRGSKESVPTRNGGRKAKGLAQSPRKEKALRGFFLGEECFS